WRQYDESLHFPPAQYCEQQSAPALHVLPIVRHADVSGAHMPPEQVPPQQEASLAHDCPSETQLVVDVVLLVVVLVVATATGAHRSFVDLTVIGCTPN